MYLKSCFLFLALLFTHSFILAQGSICNATLPTVTCPADTVLCIHELSDSLTLITPSSLPDLEYAIVDLNQPSTANTGPAIIAIIDSNRFSPVSIGVDSITTLQMFPVAYDLAAIQETLDDILKGTFFPPFNIACCTVAPEVCDQLMMSGINCGSDFTSLTQAFALFSADTNALFSIADFVDGIDSLNMTLSTPAIPSECGGGDMICYAYGAACTFEVIDLGLTPLIAFTSHITDTIAMADSIYSTALIPAGFNVQYLYGTSAFLDVGFEAQVSCEFFVDVTGGCD